MADLIDFFFLSGNPFFSYIWTLFVPANVVNMADCNKQTAATS